LAQGLCFTEMPLTGVSTPLTWTQLNNALMVFYNKVQLTLRSARYSSTCGP